MAPHIQLGPGGPERLWQRHYKHTHKEIAAATSSALYIKAITLDEERSAALPVNERATMANRQVQRVSTTTWGSTAWCAPNTCSQKPTEADLESVSS